MVVFGEGVNIPGGAEMIFEFSGGPESDAKVSRERRLSRCSRPSTMFAGIENAEWEI